jgi:hypothetical protein
VLTTAVHIASCCFPRGTDIIHVGQLDLIMQDYCCPELCLTKLMIVQDASSRVPQCL